MGHEIRKRIVREGTPEEKERHRVLREQVEQDLPELKQWARQAAVKRQDQIVIGTILTGEEATVLQAMDQYAAEHSLPGRGAVTREALARLLHIDIARL